MTGAFFCNSEIHHGGDFDSFALISFRNMSRLALDPDLDYDFHLVLTLTVMFSVL